MAPSITPSKEEAFEEHIETPHHIQDFSQNVNAKIINPLAGIPKHELLAQVEGFCTEAGLQDKIDVFKKGALVAQYPDDFENIVELTDEDKHHLRREHSRMFLT